MGPTRIMDDVKPIITEVLLASAGVIKYVSFLFSGVLNFKINELGSFGGDVSKGTSRDVSTLASPLKQRKIISCFRKE